MVGWVCFWLTGLQATVSVVHSAMGASLWRSNAGVVPWHLRSPAWSWAQNIRIWFSLFPQMPLKSAQDLCIQAAAPFDVAMGKGQLPRWLKQGAWQGSINYTDFTLAIAAWVFCLCWHEASRLDISHTHCRRKECRPPRKMGNFDDLQLHSLSSLSNQSQTTSSPIFVFRQPRPSVDQQEQSTSLRSHHQHSTSLTTRGTTITLWASTRAIQMLFKEQM